VPACSLWLSLGVAAPDAGEHRGGELVGRAVAGGWCSEGFRRSRTRRRPVSDEPTSQLRYSRRISTCCGPSRRGAPHPRRPPTSARDCSSATNAWRWREQRLLDQSSTSSTVIPRSRTRRRGPRSQSDLIECSLRRSAGVRSIGCRLLLRPRNATAVYAICRTSLSSIEARG
jgi:hypothetical protein